MDQGADPKNKSENSQRIWGFVFEGVTLLIVIGSILGVFFLLSGR